MKRLNYWAVVSVAVAAFAFWWGPVRWFMSDRGNDVPDAAAITGAIWLAWLWIATFVASLISRRSRALWLLVAAPFALYWPGMWVIVAHACDLLGRCS